MKYGLKIQNYEQKKETDQNWVKKILPSHARPNWRMKKAWDKIQTKPTHMTRGHFGFDFSRLKYFIIFYFFCDFYGFLGHIKYLLFNISI